MEVRFQFNHRLNLGIIICLIISTVYSTLTNLFLFFSFLPSQAESDQAVARISRPGQLRECESLHLITAGTIEEKVRGVIMYTLYPHIYYS